MHGHLVTVKVSVEGRTGQWVQLDGLALDHTRLERLDTQTVERRSSVQKDGMALHYVLKNVPNNRFALVDDFLCRLHRFHDSALNELANDKRLVEFRGHILWKATLVQLQVRSNNDYRTRRVVHTLTQKVLAESTLFALQAVAQRLQWAVALGLHSTRLAGVVKQAVNRLLKHTLLVAKDDLRRLDFKQALQTVVADNYPAVQIVQVAGRKTATVQGYERT